MFEFGAQAPRSIKSFGVSGLLSEDCQVLHTVVHSPKNIGRVTDLISAKLQPLCLDDFKLRVLFLIGFFNAYKSQSESNRPAFPVTIECGMDAEKLALGIAFELPEDQVEKLNGLKELFTQSTPAQGEFESMLLNFNFYADQMILRVQSDSRKLEIVALVAIPGQMDLPEKKGEPCFVEIEDLHEGGVKPALYTELGDLDYLELLKTDSSIRTSEPSPTGEILAISAKVEKPLITKVSGKVELQDTTEYRIKGSGSGSESGSIRISGVTEKIDSQTKFVAGEDSPGKPENENTKKVSGGFFSKINPFKKKSTDSESESKSKSESESESEKVTETAAPQSPSKPQAAQVTEKRWDEGSGPSDSPEVEELVNQVSNGGIGNLLSRIETEFKSEFKGAKDDKGKRWIEGLMAELAAEKTRMIENMRKVTSMFRQKENQYKGIELSLQEEIRKKDDLLRQKNNALSRMKDQVAEMTLAVERAKGNAQGAAEAVQLKKRYAQLQQMNTQYREELEALTKKHEEARASSHGVSQAVIPKVPVATSTKAEVQAVQMRLDRANKQLEEFKKMNKQLVERVSAAEKKKPADLTKIDEMKSRLQQAVKIATDRKAEADQFKLRVDELEHEVERMRAELEKKSGNKPAA